MPASRETRVHRSRPAGSDASPREAGRRRFLLATLAGVGTAMLAACSPADDATVRAVVGDEPVVLLSASWCGYCRKLRADLADWGVRYREYDVETTPEGGKAFSLLRGAGVPVLLVGKRRFFGYDPKRIRQSLADAGLLPASAQ